MDRLAGLRDVLQRIDPTRPIRRPEDHGWYVERPDGVGTILGRTLQVDPGGSHLLVGAIGCGKSTELLAAGRILLATNGVVSRYLDVTRTLDLTKADGAALLLAVGDDVLKGLEAIYPAEADLAKLRERLRPWVEGVLDPYWDVPSDDSDWVPPRIPPPSGLGEVGEYLWLLDGIRTFLAARDQTRLVCLLDGLDRVADPLEFDRIVGPFLDGMKRANIGVVVVGPARAISALDRLGTPERFDELHWMGAVDPGLSPDSPGWTFLKHVLLVRGVGDFVADARLDELVQWSGGAIRILLQLTREALKESWIRNVDAVGPDQVRAAADRVGRTLMLGLTDDELRILLRVRSTGVFAARSSRDAALVLMNRILEYRQPNGTFRHVLHPTLVGFLEAWSATEPEQGAASEPTAP